MTPPVWLTAVEYRINFQTADVIHRPLYLSGAGLAPLFPSPHNVRERSADWRTILVWHLGEGARVPCEARRLPALHCGVFHPGTVSSGPNRRLSSRDPGGFRRPSSGPPRPSCEGGPS